MLVFSQEGIQAYEINLQSINLIWLTEIETGMDLAIWCYKVLYNVCYFLFGPQNFQLSLQFMTIRTMEQNIYIFQEDRHNSNRNCNNMLFLYILAVIACLFKPNSLQTVLRFRGFLLNLML